MFQERAHDLFGGWREFGFFERFRHELNPAVAGCLVHHEWGVPHSQSWVSTLFDVALRSAESKNQKLSQAFFSALKVVGRVHWAEDVIVGNLPIERGNKTRQTVFADDIVNIGFC